MTAGRGGAKTLVLEVEAHDDWEKSKRVSGEGGFVFKTFSSATSSCMNCNENKRDRVSWGDREINR
jgi:hypothetical protein